MERNEGKRGERVRLTKDRPGYELVAGEEGTLTQDNDGAPFVKFDGHKKSWAIDMNDLELIVPKSTGVTATTTFTIATDKFYRTRNGKVTGRVSKGDTGFEAVVDGKVRIYDAAGGHVHGDADLDIVEAWVPRVGERVRFVRDSTAVGARFGRKGDTATVAGDVREGNNVFGAAVDVKVDYSSIGFNPGAYLSDLEPLPVAAPQPAAELKIEAGKFYRTRDGRKVGPMRDKDDLNYHYPFRADGGPGGTIYYRASGTCNLGWSQSGSKDFDLIAEWQDAPSAPVAAQVDTIAEEYGPVVAASRPTFKVGDRVVFRNYSGGEHCYGTVEDVSVGGKHVLASDWSIGAEVGYLPVADLELADTKPDTTLHIKFTSDFSELDAAILVRKKKLKKLIKLARKAGIELREAA